MARSLLRSFLSLYFCTSSDAFVTFHDAHPRLCALHTSSTRRVLHHACNPPSIPKPKTHMTLWSTTKEASNEINNNKEDNDTIEARKDERTLYEILNSDRDATRAELKKNYVQLAKLSHPDALGKGSTEATDVDFQKVTEAWKTLSDPLKRKRYDRTLRAQAFTQNVENAVGGFANVAGPQFLNAFENVAIPFLRRSAATTVAGFNAVSQDIKNYGENSTEFEEIETAAGKGVGGIIANAVKAGKEANKSVDRLELAEKARELRRKAMKEKDEAEKLKRALDELMKRRIQLTLHTPNAKLSSLEALRILDGFNILDEVTMLDTLQMRHTVSYEIEQLEEMESETEKKKQSCTKLDEEIDQKTAAIKQAKEDAVSALDAEERARKALEDARALVASTKHTVDQAQLDLNSARGQKAHRQFDLDRMHYGMERQQEKVRVALRRKEQMIQGEEAKKEREQNGKKDASSNGAKSSTTASTTILGDFTGTKAKNARVEIDKLIKDENFLRAESARIEAMVEKMLSRSQKLADREDELEREEEEVYHALEESVRVAGKAAESGYGRFGENKVGKV